MKIKNYKGKHKLLLLRNRITQNHKVIGPNRLQIIRIHNNIIDHTILKIIRIILIFNIIITIIAKAMLHTVILIISNKINVLIIFLNQLINKLAFNKLRGQDKEILSSFQKHLYKIRYLVQIQTEIILIPILIE